MEYFEIFTLEKGEAKTVETSLVPLTVKYEGDKLFYSRPQIDEPEADPVRKTFLIGNADSILHLSYLPVYPDRPVVFKPEDQIVVPPGEKGFFCLSICLGVGIKITETDTVLEELLEAPRKNSYWGPTTEGILTYQVRCLSASDPVDLVEKTDPLEAVVPVIFHNKRDVVQEVTKCLVPLRELDIYRRSNSELVFETLSLEQKGENDQIPYPQKRPPSGFGNSLEKVSSAPNKPRTLLENVSKFTGWQQLTGVFVDR
ncbi:MAG: hypothetical protein ACQEP7_07485 [bacterium]